MAEVAKRFGSVKAAKNALKGNRSNGVLRRLKADETIKVRFLEEPEDWFEAKYHWIGQNNFVWCNGERSCPGCKAGDRPKKLVLANAVIFGSEDDREQNKVVVMQMPPTLANTLIKFYEKRDTILDRDYDLTREGSGMNDTVYSADPDDPKSRKMSRFDNDIHDIKEIINAEINSAGDDDEDDEPRSSKTSSKNKSSRRDDDDDDEYEDDEEDDEEEEEERPRRSSRAVSKKKPARRSSHEDEDDEEEDKEDDIDYELRKKKPKSSGLDEFKPKKPTASKPRVVRRSR